MKGVVEKVKITHLPYIVEKTVRGWRVMKTVTLVDLDKRSKRSKTVHYGSAISNWEGSWTGYVGQEVVARDVSEREALEAIEHHELTERLKRNKENK